MVDGGEGSVVSSTPPRFVLNWAADTASVVVQGDWTAAALGSAAADLSTALAPARRLNLDLMDVGRVDTAGALSITRAAGDRLDPGALTARPEIARLIDLVGRTSRAARPKSHAPYDIHALVISIGRAATQLGLELIETLAFVGHVISALAGCAADPRRIRWPAWFSQAERAGLDAIPIVATTSFFIGAVVGVLGVHMLRRFGAEVMAVELIGVGVLREFGVVITGVLLAGRSASAFAAELGAMRMQQEIDALRVMGIDPVEALVLPRLGALLVTMPLLTFVAMMAGLGGGILTIWTTLGLSPPFFLERMIESVGITHFWVGISKAPIMAVVVAAIGCHQGLKVGGDVESLGRRVTAAVVHAIFAVIMIDAAFALMFTELDI